MGYNTALRVHIVVKPEFDAVIKKRMDPHDGVPWKELPVEVQQGNDWAIVAKAFPHYPFLAGWAKVDRCDSIPCGHCYMWDTDEDNEEWECSYVDREWKFQCSLKNYEGEIEQFVREVLPHITERLITIYTQSDEQDERQYLTIECLPEPLCLTISSADNQTTHGGTVKRRTSRLRRRRNAHGAPETTGRVATRSTARPKQSSGTLHAWKRARVVERSCEVIIQFTIHGTATPQH